MLSKFIYRSVRRADERGEKGKKGGGHRILLPVLGEEEEETMQGGKRKETHVSSVRDCRR